MTSYANLNDAKAHATVNATTTLLTPATTATTTYSSDYVPHVATAAAAVAVANKFCNAHHTNDKASNCNCDLNCDSSCCLTTTTTTTQATPPPSATTTTAAATGDCVGGGGIGDGGVGVTANATLASQRLDDVAAGAFAADDDEDDGREKADTTPENSKKIDDIIEQQQQQQQHTHLATSSSSPSTPNTLSSSAATARASFPVFDRVSSHATMTAATNARADVGGGVGDNDDSTAVNQFCNENAANNNNHNTMNSTSNNDDNDNENENDNDDSSATTSNTNNTSTATTATKQSYAFTIDHFNEGDNSSGDAALKAAKYKNMMERFQNRHRRGASMSKLEAVTTATNATEATTPTAATTTTATTKLSKTEAHGDGAADGVKVKMRARDRSTSRVRDAAKRHSWSPRSSANELSLAPSAAAEASQARAQRTSATAAAATTGGGSQAPKPPLSARKSSSKASTTAAVPKGSSNLMANRTQHAFTPRSTAMQMALQKVDFLCPQPPLADYKQMQMLSGGGPGGISGGEDDNVSEAGTYTLDGDNYTEEQKDLMNIDNKNKLLQQQLQLQQQQQQQQLANAARPKQLKLNSHAVNRSSNVLEVNYYHQEPNEERILSPPPPTAAATTASTQSPARHVKSNTTTGDYIMGGHQSAGAYLEQIKSRVLRNMTATPPRDLHAEANEDDEDDQDDLAKQKQQQQQQQQQHHQHQNSSTEEDDVGCFTSVTTSGVLAKQGALDPRPKLTRRSGLSTSQIDSSEFVSNETKLKNAAATDHQKSEYRLNVFTNQKATGGGGSGGGGGAMQLSDTAVLKTAQTKNDWIQEWARNARARSLANDGGGSGGVAGVKLRHSHKLPHGEELMTRSYTSASDTAECLTDDSIYSKQCAAAAAAAKLNRQLAERYRVPPGGGGEYDDGGDASAPLSPTLLPPKSPTKIPSPLHSLGRARSASRTRTPLQNILSPNCGDDELEAHEYLQKTAAAISSLQQSLTRKNSLKSPPLQQHAHAHAQHINASPRAHSARSALYSPPDERSPQHSLELGYQSRRSPLHQQRHRHGSSSSAAAAQQQQLMTSSFNEQQLQLLTSGQYMQRHMRMRKNSFDGGHALSSPVRRLEKYATDLGQMHTGPDPDMIDEQSLSPLRRSSSYSTKIATQQQQTQHHHHHHQQQQRNARPQYQNLYTPPALRHNANYSLANASSGHGHAHAHHAQHVQPTAAAAAQLMATRIKKSASSNNFDGNMYSDYDDNLQYYINDEDEELLVLDDDATMGGGGGGIGEGEYYSSGEELEMEHGGVGYYAERDERGNVMTMSATGAGGGTGGGGGGGGGAGDGAPATGAAVPLSNTRLNKALLMRIERSKQKVSGNKAVHSAPTARSSSSAAAATNVNHNNNLNALNAPGGVMACPNTPELPRRVVKSAHQRSSAGAGAGTGCNSARQSMPRDQSLSRLARQVPNSLASAKRQLLQTAAAGVPSAPPRSSSTQRSGNASVQPKYLDISKYKPAQGNNFLRKNDAKSTLVKSSLSGAGAGTGGGGGGVVSDAIRRSPSSSSMGLSRADATRNSTRSVKSVIPSCMTASGTTLGGGVGGGGSGIGGNRASSAVRRDASVSKQKEAEMAMWKRRSTYDPMKAAAEDRRKKEEAKRLAMAKQYGYAVDGDGGVGANEVPCESSSKTTSSSFDEQIDHNDVEQQTQSPRWSLGAQIYGEDEEF